MWRKRHSVKEMSKHLSLVTFALCSALVACGGRQPQYGEDPVYPKDMPEASPVFTYHLPPVLDSSFDDVSTDVVEASSDDASDANSDEDVADAAVEANEASVLSDASDAEVEDAADASHPTITGCGSDDHHRFF